MASSVAVMLLLVLGASPTQDARDSGGGDSDAGVIGQVPRFVQVGQGERIALVQSQAVKCEGGSVERADFVMLRIRVPGGTRSLKEDFHPAFGVNACEAISYYDDRNDTYLVFVPASEIGGDMWQATVAAARTFDAVRIRKFVKNAQSEGRTRRLDDVQRSWAKRTVKDIGTLAREELGLPNK